MAGEIKLKKNLNWIKKRKIGARPTVPLPALYFQMNFSKVCCASRQKRVYVVECSFKLLYNKQANIRVFDVPVTNMCVLF